MSNLMKFEFLTGDIDWVTWGGKWISPELLAGEIFSYFIVLDFLNMEELGAYDEDDPTDNLFECWITVVSPDLLPYDQYSSLFTGDGVDWLLEWVGEQPPQACAWLLVEELINCGYSAPVFVERGNDWRKVISGARHRASHVAQYPWAYIGDITNGFGANGFDMMRGERIYPQRYPEIDEETEEYISNLGDGLRNFNKYLEELRAEKCIHHWEPTDTEGHSYECVKGCGSTMGVGEEYAQTE